MPKLKLSPQKIADIEIPQLAIGPDNTVHLQDQLTPLRVPLFESARLRGLTWEQLKEKIKK